MKNYEDKKENTVTWICGCGHNETTLPKTAPQPNEICPWCGVDNDYHILEPITWRN